MIDLSRFPAPGHKGADVPRRAEAIRSVDGGDKSERISITAADLARTERFYRDGPGFVAAGRRHIEDLAVARLFGVAAAAATIESLVMRLGSDEVEFLEHRMRGWLYPGGSRSSDLWLQHFAMVVTDMNAPMGSYAASPPRGSLPVGRKPCWSRTAELTLSSSAIRTAIPLELLYFPPGRGQPLWHRPADGIDHSAVAVSDTAASEVFYGGLRGMSIAHEVTNRGPTQDALDGILGAVVRITGLRPGWPSGPGVEFLDYRAPSTGRQAPYDTASNDLAHAHLVLHVNDLERQVRSFRDNHVRFVSPGIVALGNGIDAAIVCDPDGHMLLLEGSANGQ